jgi:O-antigen/teichoic acid export membrane protein
MTTDAPVSADRLRDTEASTTGVRGARTAFTDIASVSGARAISVLLALVSVTIVTHLLVPSKYALLAYLSVISGLMFTGTASWTSTAVTRYGREELERSGSMQATSWNRLAITAPAVAIASLLIVGLKLLGALPTELTWAFVAISLGSGVSLIAAEHLLNLLEASGRMKRTAVGVVVQRAVSIVAIGFVAVLGVAHSAAAIALVWLGTGLLFAAWLGSSVWRIGMWPVRFDRRLLRRMIRFSLPMIAFAGSQYVISAVDVVILGAYRSARDVGLYAIAYNGYGVLQQVATTATIVLTPLFVSLRAASRESTINTFFERTVPQAIFLCAIVVGLGAPLVRIVVPVVFSDRFAPSAAPLELLLLAWLMFAAASFVASILVLHERTRAIGMISLLAAAVNVTGDWLLVGPLHVGIIGPAIATTAALTVIWAGYFRVAGDCLGCRPRFPVAMLIPALAGVAVALTLHGLVAVGVGVLVTAAGAVAVFVALRPFGAQDVDLIGKLDLPRPLREFALRVLVALG